MFLHSLDGIESISKASTSNEAKPTDATENPATSIKSNFARDGHNDTYSIPEYTMQQNANAQRENAKIFCLTRPPPPECQRYPSAGKQLVHTARSEPVDQNKRDAGV